MNAPPFREWFFRKACFLLASILLLAGCGATVSTRVVDSGPQIPVRSEVRSVLGSAARGKSAVMLARELEGWAGQDPERLFQASKLVLGLGKRQWRDQDGFAVMAARLAWEGLRKIPTGRWKTDPMAIEGLTVYDEALAGFVGDKSAALARGGPLTISTPTGHVTLEVRFPGAGPARPGYFDTVLVAERIQIRGFRRRAVVSGLGVALVGVRERKPGREKEMDDHPEKGITLALSALVKFPATGTSTGVVEIFDSIRTEQVTVAGRKFPLAADFTAPLALSFGGVNDLLLGIRNLFNVSVGTNDAGVYLAEPFDPNRIPVLLIHGLSSTPIVWRNVVSEAQADPVVRRNYQFWYAFYPTGAPVIYSAALIREDVVRMRRQYDSGGTSLAARRIDLVGYSMGGNVARILATNIGDRLWREISHVPLEQMRMDPADRAAIRRVVFWEPLKGVRTVIFIATPHRGTRMADASFARWGSRFVRLPGDLLGLQSRFFAALSDEFQGKVSLPARVTGIDTLSAGSPLFRAWEGLPLEKGARFYSIIGDRGRGDSPESSDGVVGFWSSHLEGAESELIVPTGHDAQAYPGTEQEIIRILGANAGQAARPKP